MTLSMYQSKYAAIIGGTFTPGPALPASFNPSQIGLHGIIVGVAEFASGFVTGRLGDKYGRKR